MTSPTFRITIAATDKATDTVKKVNEAMAKMTRPIDDVHKSFKGFGMAVADNPIAKSLGKISKAGLGVSKSITRIAAPIAAITGIGSIAGITLLADRWAKFGRATTYAAQGIGISTSKLQQYQGVATLAGVSTGSMVDGLGALGTTMEDARWGRNQGAMMMLNRLGIGLKRTKKGAFDVNAEFMAVAKVMTSPKLNNNPWAQQLVASQLGMTALLPLLRQGEVGIKKYQALQKQLGYVSSPTAIKNANNFALALAGMKISAEGLGQSVMDKAMPALKPFIEDLSKWLGKNRELIATDVAKGVTALANAIQKVDWKSVGTDMGNFFKHANGEAGDLRDTLDAVASTIHGISNTWNNAKMLLRPGGVVAQAIGKGGFWSSADAAEYAAQHADDPAYQARQRMLLRDDPTMSLAGFKQQAGWMERLRTNAKIQADYQSYLNNATAQTFLDPMWTARGIRNNNPGNLNWAGQAGAMRESGPNGRFAVFKSPSAGISALATQLRLYGSRGNDTIAGIVKKFAPAADGNDTSAYIAALTGSTGFKAGAHLNLSDPAVVGPLVNGIITQENGSDPYPKTLETSAVNAGLGVQGPYSAGAGKGGGVHVQVELKNAPPGTTARATATGNATTAPPRIGYSAVGAGT